MQGAVFFGDRKAGLREFPEPEPGPGEVVVAVRALLREIADGL